MSPQPKTFTRKRDGQTQTRVAHTPAAEVALKFAGWVEQKKTAKTETPSTSAKTDAKTTTDK